MSAEEDVLGLYAGGEEYGGHRAEAVGAFGGEVAAAGVAGEAAFHFGMTAEIVGKRSACNLTLQDEGDAARDVFADFAEKEGIVGAAEYDGVNQRVGIEKAFDFLLHEVIGTGACGLAVFDKGNPHRTCVASNGIIRIKFGYLHVVGTAGYRAGCAEYADVARTAYLAEFFDRRTNYAEHTARGVVHSGEVVLLNCAQCLCGSGIATEDYQGASLPEKILHRLESEAVDNLERTDAVGRAGVVAKIYVVILRKSGAQSL